MFAGVDTKKFYDFLKHNCYERKNIMICEGITNVLCNINVMKNIVRYGYKLHVIELNMTKEQSITNVIERNQNIEKSLSMINLWGKKEKQSILILVF